MYYLLILLHVTQCSIAAHPQYLALIEKLSAHVPHPSLEKFFFSSAGKRTSIRMSNQKCLTFHSQAPKPLRQLSKSPEWLRRSKTLLRCKVMIRISAVLDTFLPSFQNTGAYHGRTYGAMAITSSKTGYAAGAMPLMVGR